MRTKKLKKYDVYGLISQVGTFKKELKKVISVEAEEINKATSVGQNYCKMMGQSFSHVNASKDTIHVNQ